MGIGSFFKKVWGGIKKGATKVYDFGKKVVGKVGHVLRPITDIASKVGGFMSMLPGKAGKIGQGLAAGGQAIKTLTGMLPESQAKQKIESAIDRGLDTGQRYLKEGTDRVTQISDRVQPWIRSGVQIGRTIADGADRLYAKM